jgi:hypothetical protein
MLIGITFLASCISPKMNQKPSSTNSTEEVQTSGEKVQTQVIDLLPQVEKDLEFLTSDECSGRKPGTPGNKKAAEYIAKRYEEIGLLPLDQDYAIPFTKSMQVIVPDSIRLELLDGKKTMETFTHGEDFIEQFLVDVDQNLPLLEQPGNVDCAVLVEDIDQAAEYRKNPHVKLILRKYENSKRGGSFYYEGCIPEIGIFSQQYEKLKKNIGKSVHFTADINIQDAMQDNIVGVIKGENNSKALIVSAHFDHVGSVGDKIWRGALDNASGVCTLLEAARIVKELYQHTTPPYDIVFCAFNSEEGGLTEAGSTYFIEQMKDRYQSMFDINIDCLGSKRDTALLIDSNESNVSNQVKDDMIASLQKVGIGNVEEHIDYYASDHRNFTDSICLTTVSDVASSTIHTLEDTPDKIDTDFLLQVGNCLGEYIVRDMNMEDLFRSLPVETGAEEEIVREGKVPKSLSVEEFDELYHCKLDFADDYVSRINVGGSRDSFHANGKNDKTDTDDMTLWDIRDLILYLDKDKFSLEDDIRLNFISYDKNDSMELFAKDEDWRLAGFGEKALLSPIQIGDSEYYLADYRENYNRSLYTFYENEKVMIRVSITFDYNEDSIERENNDQDWYKERFVDIVPEEYISGMVDLLLNNTQ